MAKEKFSRTKACATKTLYAVMKEMIRRGGSIPAKEIYPWVNGNVGLQCCIWYQIKALAKEYGKKQLEEFNVLYKALADKMRPMVFALGFLK